MRYYITNIPVSAPLELRKGQDYLGLTIVQFKNKIIILTVVFLAYFYHKNRLVDTHSTKEEHIWQAEWGFKAMFSSGTSASRGVAILFIRHYK